MDTLIRDLQQYTDQIWLTEPQDIANMKRRNVDNGKNFSVFCYCNGHIESAATAVYEFYRYGCAAKGDLATFRLVAASECRRFSVIFGVYYDMHDLSAFLQRAAEAYEQAPDFEAFAALSQVLQHYLVCMAFWVDTSIPWDTVSQAFSQLVAQQ